MSEIRDKEQRLNTERVKKIISGDIIVAARLMRDVDDGVSESYEVLKMLYPYTGNSHIIGVTGSTGVGKSTLIDKLINIFRRDGKRLGVIAIDPSSPFTGGAILGDRIRMQSHSTDEGVFIRSLATRGQVGGISKSTIQIMHVMDAMKMDIIIIETVGAGQDEVEISKSVHTSLVVLSPSLGDDMQIMKAGLIEIGDIFVLNKSDLNGAESAFREIKYILGLSKEMSGWHAPVFKVEAHTGKGVDELVKTIYEHKNFYEMKLSLEVKEEKIKEEFLKILNFRFSELITRSLYKDKKFDIILKRVLKKEIDIYSAVDEIISQYIT